MLTSWNRQGHCDFGTTALVIAILVLLSREMSRSGHSGHSRRCRHSRHSGLWKLKNRATKRKRVQRGGNPTAIASIDEWLKALKKVIEEKAVNTVTTVTTVTTIATLKPASIEKNDENIGYKKDSSWEIDSGYYPDDIRILASAVRASLEEINPNFITKNLKWSPDESEPDKTILIQEIRQMNKQLFDIIVSLENSLEKRSRETLQGWVPSVALVWWAVMNLAVLDANNVGPIMDQNPATWES